MTFGPDELTELAALAKGAARAAGRYIGASRSLSFAIEHKAVGDSEASQVVTEIDRKAQAIILDELAPSLGRFELAVLSEESPDDRQRLEKPAFWSIDPMDGTLAFVQGNPGFAVSIALVARNGEPLLGVVHDPLSDTLYHAAQGDACFKNGKRLTLPTLHRDRPLVLQTDISFRDHPWLDSTRAALNAIAIDLGLPGAEIIFRVGAVMNACSILEDANRCYLKYPRSGEAGGSLWDYAATARLFKSLGATAFDIFGAPLALNRAESTFMNHAGIVYTDDAMLAERLIAMHRQIAEQCYRR